MSRLKRPLLALVALAATSNCSGTEADTAEPMSSAGLGTDPSAQASNTGAAPTDAVPSTSAPVQTAGPLGAPPAVPAGQETEFVDAPTVMNPEEVECAGVESPTELINLVLAFTFDVSASMGSHDQPYYSRLMKWDPVVSATKAFFGDTSSQGVSASLTFFPNDQASLTGAGFGGGGMGMMGGGGFQQGGASCDAANYETPDVPLTLLPSEAFATAIDAATPADDDSWRLGTPTGPALEGTLAMIQTLRETDANSKYVIVLVTDGAPALCSEEQDDIDNVAAVAASALADGIQTYVIGVANPVTEEEPAPPDDTGNLLAIAQAGGTEQAFIIDTNDPAKTVTDFKSVIEGIRENGFSCEVLIPEPPEGETFDKEKVNVGYTNAQGETPFVYDPTCTERYAWRYDDEAAPTVIELCEAVCGDIKADSQSQGELKVQFGCKQRIGVER